MNEYWKHFDDIRSELETVRSIMEETLHSRVPMLDEALTDLSLRGGKMLRPALVLISSRFGTPDDTKIHRMAAAVELLHMATLVHDDVMDEAETRRGKPAVHRVYGKKRAILIGDYLLSRSFNLIAEYATPENARRLSQASMDILSGEITQSAGLFVLKRSVREYLQRIAGKTAVLFAASCYTGATESGVSERTAEVLRRVGYNLGMGFQIIDDILDYESSEAEMGKPVGNDLRQGVFTLPLILCRTDDGAGKKDRLAALLSKHPYNDASVASIIALVKERGGIDRAREYAGKYTERARREIGRLPEGRPRAMLSFLAEKLLERRY